MNFYRYSMLATIASPVCLLLFIYRLSPLLSGHFFARLFTRDYPCQSNSSIFPSYFTFSGSKMRFFCLIRAWTELHSSCFMVIFELLELWSVSYEKRRTGCRVIQAHRHVCGCS